MTQKQDPVQPADAAAKALARDLMAQSDHAALAYSDPVDGLPGISRIAFGTAPDGAALTLISALSAHHAALVAAPTCAVMLGEPGPKGDPLTHPRLMLKAVADFVAQDAPDRAALRDHWLIHHPKSKLYIDFADFTLVRFRLTAAFLNGGFGKAFRLTPQDLMP